MAEDGIQPGKITKVVHVRFAANGAGKETNLADCDGYGILQGKDGRDIFFVDSALQDAQFSELEAGKEALYVIEMGPLHRAAKVWVRTSINEIRDDELDSLKNDSRITSAFPFGENL